MHSLFQTYCLQAIHISSCICTGVVIGFEEGQYSASEEDGIVEVAVVLIDGVLSRSVEINIATVDDTATGN